jgi:hypothetical protein
LLGLLNERRGFGNRLTSEVDRRILFGACVTMFRRCQRRLMPVPLRGYRFLTVLHQYVVMRRRECPFHAFFGFVLLPLVIRNDADQNGPANCHQAYLQIRHNDKAPEAGFSLDFACKAHLLQLLKIGKTDRVIMESKELKEELFISVRCRRDKYDDQNSCTRHARQGN